MVNAAKHRKLKENPFLNWNLKKRTSKIKRQRKDLGSFINVGKHFRNELKELENFKI